MCVLVPGLSLSIIWTLLSMCGTKFKSTCSRPAGPGASPYDPRGRLHANNTKSIVPTHIWHTTSLFMFIFYVFIGIFSFFISCGGSKYNTNSKYRHPRHYVIGLHKTNDVLLCSREINSYKMHCTNTQQCYS
jgi:hypothetical protein